MPLLSLSPSFSLIPTDHVRYIVHSWYIKCFLYSIPYWLAFAELSRFFQPYLSHSTSSCTAPLLMQQDIFFLANFDQVMRNSNGIGALAR